MITNDFSRYGVDLTNFVDVANMSQDKLFSALENPYYTFSRPKKNGDNRIINAPHEHIKPHLAVLNKLLRQVRCPPYNYAGYEGQNAYLNAKAHVGNFAFVTMDISDYYSSSKAEYVEKMLSKYFNIKDNYLNFLMKILTYNGYIPTGAPTSPILAFLSHKELFDEIYEYTRALDIIFTLYYDDITLSAKHGITMEVVKHLKEILANHGLQLNPRKTVFYSYKKALITGYYVHQSGKISVPYSAGHDVIKRLREKDISEMTKTELEKLIGKINYIQYINKKAFRVVKNKACKRLGKLTKKQERKN